MHVLHAADGNFPSDMSLSSPAGLEEELRLFYVALTRARRLLHVYAPLRYHHRPRGRDDVHNLAQLSRFLTPDVQALFDVVHVGRTVPVADVASTAASASSSIPPSRPCCGRRRPRGRGRSPRVRNVASVASRAARDRVMLSIRAESTWGDGTSSTTASASFDGRRYVATDAPAIARRCLRTQRRPAGRHERAARHVARPGPRVDCRSRCAGSVPRCRGPAPRLPRRTQRWRHALLARGRGARRPATARGRRYR